MFTSTGPASCSGLPLKLGTSGTSPFETRCAAHEALSRRLVTVTIKRYNAHHASHGLAKSAFRLDPPASSTSSPSAVQIRSIDLLYHFYLLGQHPSHLYPTPHPPASSTSRPSGLYSPATQFILSFQTCRVSIHHNCIRIQPTCI
jgi:hypothetical protein